MGRDFMLYWRWDNVEYVLRHYPVLFEHAHSEQLDRVEAGDTLWIVTMAPQSKRELHGQLFLVGRLHVGFRTNNLEEAIRRLGTDDLWDATWHVGAAPETAEPFRLVSLASEAGDLRFASVTDRLKLNAGRVEPQSLRSMRQLTPATAHRLESLWEASRLWPAGGSPVTQQVDQEQTNQRDDQRQASHLRIFVSHSHEDSEWCRVFVWELSKAGADVWYDEHNLGQGRLLDVIQRELADRSIFIVILSPAAVSSRFVQLEVEAAITLQMQVPTADRTILPVMAEGCTLPLFWRTFRRISGPADTALSPQEAAGRALNALSRGR